MNFGNRYVFVLFAGLIFAVAAPLKSAAQTVGVSGYVHAMNIWTEPDYFAKEERYLNRRKGIQTGVRIERTSNNPGNRFPKRGFTGWGLSYLFPKSDSGVAPLSTLNGMGEEFAVTRRVSILEGSLRLGFEIPQPAEFLQVHFGLGVGLFLSWTTLNAPDQPGFDPALYDPADFETQLGKGASSEFMVCTMYELERFYIVATYSGKVYMGLIAATQTIPIYHGLTAGIYYPINF
jgi:hypothetical protein